MAIESVSGAATAPIRTNTELVKRENEDADEKASIKSANEDREDERKLEDVKGVKEVDAKA